MENIPGILTGRKAEMQTSKRKRYGHEQDFLFLSDLFIHYLYVYVYA